MPGVFIQPKIIFWYSPFNCGDFFPSIKINNNLIYGYLPSKIDLIPIRTNGFLFYLFFCIKLCWVQIKKIYLSFESKQRNFFPSQRLLTWVNDIGTVLSKSKLLLLCLYRKGCVLRMWGGILRRGSSPFAASVFVCARMQSVFTFFLNWLALDGRSVRALYNIASIFACHILAPTPTPLPSHYNWCHQHHYIGFLTCARATMWINHDSSNWKANICAP